MDFLIYMTGTWTIKINEIYDYLVYQILFDVTFFFELHTVCVLVFIMSKWSSDCVKYLIYSQIFSSSIINQTPLFQRWNHTGWTSWDMSLSCERFSSLVTPIAVFIGHLISMLSKE